MGNLLKVLTYNELDQGPNFFLDFESEMGFLFSVFSFRPYPEFHIHAILSSLSPSPIASRPSQTSSPTFAIRGCPRGGGPQGRSPPGALCSPLGPRAARGPLVVSRTAVTGQPGLTPSCPPLHGLAGARARRTDQGENPARKGCGPAGEPWDGVLAPRSGSRRPGPRSEPSGFLSPGRCPADAQPTEAETAVWNQVNAVLEEAQTILAELQSYTGAGQEIREVGAAPAPSASPSIGPWGNRGRSPFPGHPKPRGPAAAGARLERRVPLGRQAETLLRVLPAAG